MTKTKKMSIRKIPPLVNFIFKDGENKQYENTRNQKRKKKKKKKKSGRHDRYDKII